GLRFNYLGTTDYVPSATNPGTYPADTDLVIAWSDAATVPVLAGSVIGVGGAYVTYSAPARLLRGGVSLDRQGGLPAGFGNGASTGALLLHEVGHVLGLGHETVDTLQVMYPALTSSATPWYEAGDRTGLARLGYSPGCSAPRAVSPDRTVPADARWVQIT
ncbi:MAG TPA: matrixin family metalloprotease, partial [Streptosporangiaceae bacterium]|nr:matrixin family metalloprotease [Streptosporangiaceae bacterium]